MQRAIALALASATVLLAAAPALAQEPPPPYPWDDRARAATAFAKNRLGRVAWAVVTPDRRVRGRGIHARYHSASVVKAMLMVAYLNERGVRGRPLNRRDERLLSPMITRSDNRAASRVRDIVGNAGLVALARRARMKDFAPGASWGDTQISAFDQARLFHRIDRFIPQRHRGYARTLLASVVGSQRWGLPPVLPDGWRIYLKGGWRPPRLVHQVAVFERGDTRVAIAVLTDGDPSFRYGRATIEGIGERLLAGINEFTP